MSGHMRSSLPFYFYYVAGIQKKNVVGLRVGYGHRGVSQKKIDAYRSQIQDRTVKER